MELIHERAAALLGWLCLMCLGPMAAAQVAVGQGVDVGLPSHWAEDLPTAVMAVGDGSFIVGRDRDVEQIAANGMVLARWASSIPAGTRCTWQAVGDYLLIGSCERRYSVTVGDQQEARVDLSVAGCGDGECNHSMTLAGVDPSEFRGLTAGYHASRGILHAVLHRRQTNDEGVELNPEQVEVYLQGSRVHVEPVNRDDEMGSVTADRSPGRFLRLGNLGRVDVQLGLLSTGASVTAVRVGSTLTLRVAGKPDLGPFRSSYDWHLLVGSDDTVHLVYYEPDSRSLQHLRVPLSASSAPIPQTVDSSESGFESHVTAEADGIHVWYYFYRNAFYKGLRHVVLPWTGGAQVGPLDVLHSEQNNLGWGVVASGASAGQRLLCYGVGRSAQFTMAATSSPEVPSGQCSVVPAYLTHEVPEVRHPRYRPFFFMAGGGLWARPWNMWSISPSTEDLDGSPPYDIRYDIGSAIQSEAVLEGRIGRTRLGLSYARSFTEELEDTVITSALGDAPKLVTSQFRGLVSFDRLLGSHDLQLQFRSSQMNVEIRDESPNPFENRLLEGQATEVWLLAMNIYRMRYGLRYQNFSTVLPVYRYEAGAGQSEYRFVGAGSGEVRMHDIGAIFGYSLLDYAAKYETRLRRFYLDGNVGAGIALAQFEQLGEDGNSDTPIQPSVFAEAEAGYLMYRRYAGAGQLGLYMKLGVRVFGEWRGFAGKPGDRDSGDEDFDEDSTVDAFNLVDLRYGPFLQLGTVF
jgi:hypothetical protein